jgi:MATE family multidrug resistance protein
VKVGLVLQRSFAVLTAMSVPLLCLWFFVYDIYMYIGVERDVCEVIKSYVYIRALAVPIDIINESYEKYLMSIGVMEPSMWSNVAFNIFVVVFNSAFVFGFGWGYRSLAISWVLSTYLMAFVQIGLSLRYPSVLRTLQPWDWRAFEEWPQFIMLGLPGTVMLCSEWWAFEFLMLLATFLGTAQVAAQAIILQISSIAFMVPLGIGVTCASFVGNAIGAGKLKLAQQIGKLSLAYAVVINTILSGIILLGADQFVALFTTDPHVIEETDRAIPFLAMFIMIDGLQGVASGKWLQEQRRV